MLHIFYQAFTMLLQPGSLLAMLLGGVIGLIVGVVPGIGGPFALALLMPLTYTMDPVFGIVMLVTLVSVVGNGGSVSAILIGVPGTPTNAATVMDGFQMTRHGEAGRALSACLTTSAVGGVFGAVVLILIMPVMRAVILSFGHPELFMITVLGISFVAVLGEGSMLKAFATAAAALVIALVGYDPNTGAPRYDLGIIYLYDGIKILPITLGLFAMPEMMGLYADLQSGEAKTFTKKEVWQGVKDVFEHWFLVVRCSILGTVIGMVPGLGAEAAIFLA
jgi:putative tricarboxylic transport membrane protein